MRPRSCREVLETVFELPICVVSSFHIWILTARRHEQVLDTFIEPFNDLCFSVALHVDPKEGRISTVIAHHRDVRKPLKIRRVAFSVVTSWGQSPQPRETR